MEGPTPVSALIHAATMVTAGVFLIARCSAIFEHSQITLNIITVVGATTAIFAATIGFVQNDIKRIIAYSTCSQLGYMFFACGLSAYSAAIFHLFTHAFFKALLFLGAGSVIHGMNGEQDIHKMGGLKKYMPFTYAMMLIASIAIAGIPPLAGFFSKDAIIESAYNNSSAFGQYAYYSGLFAAFLTAFYSWRLIILVFEKRSENQTKPHESEALMLLPLFVLSLGALLSGFIGEYFGMLDLYFWHGSIVNLHAASHHESNYLIKFLPSIIAIGGIVLAYVIYGNNYNLAAKIAAKFKPIYKLFTNAYYFDSIYKLLFITSTKHISKFLFKISDNKVIDAIPRSLTYFVSFLGKLLKSLHSGNVQTYIVMMLIFVSLNFYQLISEMNVYNFWLISIGLILLYSGILMKIKKDCQTNENQNL
jgi:NADH-quinone oxidoreductase subunit L